MKAENNSSFTSTTDNNQKLTATAQSTPLYFFLLVGFLLAGLLAGSFIACAVEMNREKTFIPMFFSGIPIIGSGFFSVFSTFLLNIVTTLLLLFLMGTTAFGFLAVPALVLLKGLSIGIAAVSFLYGGQNGLVQSAFTYMPAMAIMSLVMLLFGMRAFYFSRSFSKSFFSAEKIEMPNFTDYLRDFFIFVVFAVFASAVGSIFTLLFPLIFK